jgi:signal transduction histidine kinase
MRTPLTAIIGAVQALQAGAMDIPEERDRFLEHLGREAARLSRLSESLLVLAGLDGTRVLARTPVVLLEVLDDVAADLVVAPGVALRVDADPELEVTTNQGLVERVVANFAQNAAKHTAEGRIELTARRDGDAVVVEVRDTGTGLGEGTAERAFDRFYRGGDRSSHGFGLGLAIARQAAAAVGGAIDLGPAPGGGTLARLVLPARLGGRRRPRTPPRRRPTGRDEDAGRGAARDPGAAEGAVPGGSGVGGGDAARRRRPR